MQVHYGEGIANHTGPESCAVRREVYGEALTGVHAGQPLSRETTFFQDADAVVKAEGMTNGYDIASARTVLRGRRTWHVWMLFAREPGDLQFDHSPSGVVRVGKARSRNR